MSANLGISVSQCFDSIERLFESQLLESDRKSIRRERMIIFLEHALPFILPAKLLGQGIGIALPINQMVFSNKAGVSGENLLLWSIPESEIPAEEGNARGLTIEPLHSGIFHLCKRIPQLGEVLACVEILRFYDSPLKAKALTRLKQFLFQNNDASAVRSKQIPSDLLERISGLIAENGFLRTTFETLSRDLNVSKDFLIEKFGSCNNLYSEVGRHCVAKANAHLGRVLFARGDGRIIEARESLLDFFNFLESNEDYFRLGIWYYCEKLHLRSEEISRLSDPFFSGLESFFATIPSERSPMARGCVFASSWVSFAWLRWFEVPKMADRSQAELRLHSFKETLLNLLD